jgi:hypothetical protein
VLQDARKRVKSGVAHIAAAATYPPQLRTTPTTKILSVLEKAILKFRIVSERRRRKARRIAGAGSGGLIIGFGERALILDRKPDGLCFLVGAVGGFPRCRDHEVADAVALALFRRAERQAAGSLMWPPARPAALARVSAARKSCASKPRLASPPWPGRCRSARMPKR